MLIRTKLILNLATQSIMLSLIGVAVFVLMQSQAELDAGRKRQLELDGLAAHLQKSSDELTQMARLFVVTRDARFADYYRHIWRMRDGLAPHPPQYDLVYWDIVLGQATPEELQRGPVTRSNSMLERLRDAGLSRQEFGLLEEARRRSDGLIKLEEQAMGLVDTRGSGKGLLSEADWMRALDMLHGAPYRRVKAEIMAPLREFREILAQRASTEAALAQRHIFAAWVGIGVALCLLLFNVLWPPVIWSARCASPWRHCATGPTACARASTGGARA